MPRVLLLETQNEERYRSHRAEGLPFLLGRAQARALDGQWWTVPVPPAFMHTGHRYVVDLPQDRLALLQEALRAWQPDVVVQNDRHAPALQAALRAAAPNARFIDRPDLTFEWLTLEEADELLDGAPRPPQPEDTWTAGALLVDAAQPSYQRRFLLPPDQPRPGQCVNLVSAQPCVYVSPTAQNPLYRDLQSPAAQQHRGCAFCLHNDPARRVHRSSSPPVELLLRQVKAHQRATEPTAEPPEYLFQDIRVGLALDKLADAALAQGLRPSAFVTMLRADDVLATLPRLEHALEAFARGRHTLRLVSIGAENFSEVENLRLNKGVTQDQLWACVDAIEDLTRRFPGTFLGGDEGHFAGILFTPWTRPEDVLANVEASRRLGWVWLEKVIGTRLQLWPTAPITELARHDGLTTEAFAELDVVAPIAMANADNQEIPWRFADPRTALLHRILTRLDKVPFSAALAPDEPLRREVHALREQLPDPGHEDRIGLCADVVRAVIALGAKDDVAEVFAEVARAQRAAGKVAPPRKPEPLSAPRELPFGHREVQAALVVLREVAARHADKLLGYRLVAQSAAEDQGQRIALLDFANGDRRFGLVVRLRRPGAPHWLASERFALAHADATPPQGDAERRLAQIVLRAIETHVPKVNDLSGAAPATPR